MQKITPFLWFMKDAEEAASSYAIFPDARITSVTRMPSDSPGGPPELVRVVEFVLGG